jgi:hypothetical protein
MIAMGFILSIAAAAPAVGLERPPPADVRPPAPIAAGLQRDALVVIRDLADPSELAGPQRAILIKPGRGPVIAPAKGGSGIV